MAISNDSVSFDRVAFDQIKKAGAVHLGSYSQDSMNIRVEDSIPYMTGKVMEITFNVLASKIAEDSYSVDFTYKNPNTWFQHLKRDYFPSWLTNKFPVKYASATETKVVKLTRMAEYPKANVAIDKDRPFFVDTLGGLEVIRDSVGVVDD